MSDFLVFMSGDPVLWIPSREYLLIVCSRDQGGTCVPRSHGIITIAEIVLGRLSVPGIAQTAD